LDEYRQVESLDYIMVVESNAPEVVLWARNADRTWIRNVVEGIDRTVDLFALGVSLPLAEIYDGVEFPARPRLVRRDAATRSDEV
jgi:hypothetical protein